MGVPQGLLLHGPPDGVCLATQIRWCGAAVDCSAAVAAGSKISKRDKKAIFSFSYGSGWRPDFEKFGTKNKFWTGRTPVPIFICNFLSQKKSGQLLWVPMRESDPDASIDDGWTDAALYWGHFWRPLIGCGYGGWTRLPRILPHR